MPKPTFSILPSLDLHGRYATYQALVAVAFLLLAMLCGGSSSAGVAGNAVIEVAATVAIAVMLVRPATSIRARAERQLLMLVGAFVTLYLLQLVPLPPFVWETLPGRHYVIEGLKALGLQPGWMPVSLAPAQTVASGLSLLAPIAIILMIFGMPRGVSRVLILGAIAITASSILIGAAQFSGQDSLYFYSNTNGGSAVGFFANANHFGTLMCLTMPLAAGFVKRWNSDAGRRTSSSNIVQFAMLFGVILLALLGVTMTKSVAAVILSLLSIVSSVLIVLSGLNRSLRLALLGGIVLITVLTVIVAIVDGGQDLVTTSLGASSDLSRVAMWQTALNALTQFGSAGAGFGSFEQLFHLFENPEVVSVTFANHLHNDLLEFTIEGGVPGAILLAFFLTWFGRRMIAIWLTSRRRDPIAQGASIAALVVMLHSLVDYPLRTLALATLFGLCLALMARETAPAAIEMDGDEQPGRHLSA